MTPDNQFTAGAYLYMINGRTMPPMTEFHVLRRMQPLLPALKEMVDLFYQKVSLDPKEGEAKLTPDDTFAAIMKTGEAIHALSDEDSEYIINACMATVQRQSGQGWAPVWNKEAGASMFQDIGMAEMLQITVAVLRYKFGGFFLKGASISNGAPQD